jgi:hypothetical protein
MATTPLADIIAEADRLLAAAHERNVRVRLIGGLAVYFHADHVHPALARPYGDIDVATTKSESRGLTELMTDLGYEPARQFNALHGRNRLLFRDVHNERKVDVFIDRFEMCHVIPITGRIALDERTIPLAELLLTKLQVVALTEKDLRDVAALFHHHEVADHDDDAINAAFVAGLTADDWGLWRTVKLNVARLHEQIGMIGLDPDDQQRVLERVDALWARIEAEPKSTKWRLRDRVGDRKRWYEVPDEI